MNKTVKTVKRIGDGNRGRFLQEIDGACARKLDPGRTTASLRCV